MSDEQKQGETTPVVSSQEAPVPASTPQAAPASHSNGLGIAALVVGIVAIISGWVPFWSVLVGAAAVVLGILGLKKAQGKGMSIAGIITGAIGLLWGLLITILFIVALVAGVGAANTAQQAINKSNSDTQAVLDSKKDFNKGETANFANKFEVKVNSVQQNYTPQSQYDAPDAGKQYIVVNLTVKNISSEQQYVSDYDYSVSDNGLAQDSSFLTVDPALPSGDLAPGASVTGNIVYSVSQGATNLKLQYSTDVYDTTSGSKKLTYTLAI
ncbi:MAG TPA: DUF4190 domain-containing protein [Dongiaceae bacterium]|nr:DUF4190 domain-containing protein [Dongiaceae bacterium]